MVLPLSVNELQIYYFCKQKQIMNKILLSFLLFLSVGAMAQNHNQTDDKGRRQGSWMDFYPNGQKRYEGQFKNDRCTGEFKYYDEQGRLKATNTFDKTGEKALNKTYAENGTLIATGYYINQQKEGKWRYFSRDNGKVILVEDNRNGKVNGKSWVYYENGTLMMERQFVDGLQEGHAKVFYPSGALKEEGDYLHGNKTGVWKAFNEDGDVISSENFTAPSLNGFD